VKVTVEWLKEYVHSDASAEEIGSTLTMVGVELEGITESDLGPVLEFKVTPNRGDCLSVFGLARELAARDPQRFAPTQLFRDALSGWVPMGTSDAPEGIITIDDSELCPRYACQLFEDVSAAKSKPKLQARLQACGMRPIDVIVDTTNYVMLELGQPLHAFDANKLRGGRIIVRRAAKGETITTLDGAKRKLDEGMLLICDAEKPVAIAGIMGGEDSEVGTGTKALLLESAHFDPVSVRKTRRALGMSTEASYRFERYVDPNGVVRALNRFAGLLAEQTGVKPYSKVADHISKPFESQDVSVRENKWNSLLGVEVPISAAAVFLRALGCSIREGVPGELIAEAPAWRNDLALEEDFVEEIGRLWGYDRIPEALPPGAPQGGESKDTAFVSALHGAMLRTGFTEVVTHTFGSQSPLDSGDAVLLRNPAAPELARLRTSLLPGIVSVASRNRGRPLFLFEIGRVFPAGHEARSLGFLMSGGLLPSHWKGEKPPAADFFAAKGVVEQLGALCGRNFDFSPSSDPRLHPTRQAAVSAAGKILGLIGELGSEIAKALDAPSGTLVAELDIETILSCPEVSKSYSPLSQFPSVRRDIAVVVAKNVPYSRIADAIALAGDELTEDVTLFDAYEGQGIEEGEHSLAFAWTLRHKSKTLTDEEANLALERAIKSLKELGGRVRS
jgi:phenylalanyl-tRNA synthetase beta chain